MTDRKGLGMERYELVVRENPFDGGAYAEAVVTEDGNYTLYADAQATVEALQKKYDDLLGKYRQLVDFYDKHNGTPCEQIRHQQQVEALQAQLPAEMQGCTILFKECEKGHGRLVATNWRDHGCQTCEVEALRRELESANALLHKKNCAIGKAEMAIEALQRERDEAIREHGKESGFWGRTCARLLDKRDKLQAALDAARETNRGLVTLLQQYVGETGVSESAVEVLTRKLNELTQLQARVRELEQPVYVCQGCGRLGRDGWLPTSFTSDELRGSVQCPDCGCIDREKNTARELAAICTKAQSELAQRTAELEALRRERDEYERKCRDLCQAHGVLLIEHHDAKKALDAEREKVRDGETAYKKLSEQWNAVDLKLSQLQALVRAFIEAWDHDGEPSAVAYEDAVARARATLDATTPAPKGGDGE